MLVDPLYTAPHKGTSIHLICWTFLCICILSCGRATSDIALSTGITPEAAPERGIDTVVYEVKDEYLVTVAGNEWTVKAGSPDTIPYTGIRRIGSGSPRRIEIDHSKLEVFTPGKDSIPLPRVYTFPEPTGSDWDLQRSTGAYAIQHGDTVFAPVIVRARHTQAIQASAMRMKDAATLDIQCLGVGQGLKDPYINDILQDSKGNTWFASRNEGLIRYDGTSFKYFGEKNGLSNYITALIEDRDGNIWIGTGWGIYKYDGMYFTHFHIGIGLKNNILSIVEARNGNIWFGTNEGLLEYNGNQWTHYTGAQGLSTSGVNTIMEDRKGNIWTGGGIGICKYDGTSFTVYTETEGLNSDFINCIIEDKNGNLWIGTTRGVCRFDGDSFAQYALNEGINEHIVRSMMEDSGGVLWIGTIGGGLYSYDGDSFIQYTSREGLSSNVVSSIHEDKGEDLWFATWGGGVMKFRRNSFSYFAQFENFSRGNVTFVEEAPDGTIMFATQGGGILLYKDGSFRNLNMNHGLPIDFIFSIYSEGNGIIWIGTIHGGFYKYDGESITSYWNRGQVGGSGAKYMMRDRDGELWIATFLSGIKKYDGDSITYFQGNPEDQSAMINKGFPKTTSFIMQDSRGNIWYCSDDGYGAFEYDGEFITHHILTEDSLVQWVTTIFEDKDRNIWFGTKTGGVYKYDQGKFTCFTENEGLSSNSISSIIEDKQGNIWIGTNKGLSRLSLLDDGSYLITSLGTEDGLKHLNFIQNAVCLDSQNRLWWGTGDIVTMLDLNHYVVTQEQPEVVLRNILVNQEFIDFGHFISTRNEMMFPQDIKFQDVALFNNYPIEPELPYYLNHLTFHFSAIEWKASQKIKYQYLLEGMDDRWSPPGIENMADYRNIPPGKYTFRVKAVSTANVWSDTFEYPFRIKPPWWWSWWTMVFYGLILLLLLRYGIKYLVGREQIKAEVQIKQLEVEKMQELDQMKSRFFANISYLLC